MGVKEGLEQGLRESRKLIREFEEILRLSNDPKEKGRARRDIEEQREFIESYLEEYIPLCKQAGLQVPDDIHEIITTAVPEPDALPVHTHTQDAAIREVACTGFHHELAAMRDNTGLSPTEFIVELHRIEPQTISFDIHSLAKWETGVIVPDPDTLLALVRLFIERGVLQTVDQAESWIALAGVKLHRWQLTTSFGEVKQARLTNESRFFLVNIPKTLLESVASGQCVAILGAAPSKKLDEMLTHGILKSLGREVTAEVTEQELIELFVQESGKSGLRELLKECSGKVESAGVQGALARLTELDAVITSSWDDLIERAYGEIERHCQVNPVDGSLGRGVNLYKLLGGLGTAAFVVTEEEMELFNIEHHDLTRALEELLRDRTCLLIGLDPDNFRDLFLIKWYAQFAPTTTLYLVSNSISPETILPVRSAQILPAPDEAFLIQLDQQLSALPFDTQPVALRDAADIPQYAVFRGREQELNQLNRLLLEKRAVVVQGLGGIGKTALVARFVEMWGGPYKGV